MSAKDLKEEVRNRGLPVTGTIPELLSRLVTGKKHPKDEAIEIAQRLGANPYLRDKFNEQWPEEEGYAKNAIYKVYKLLVHYPIKITSGKQAMKIKGIGKGSAQHIEQWLAEEASGKTAEEDEEEKGLGAEAAEAAFKNAKAVAPEAKVPQGKKATFSIVFEDDCGPGATYYEEFDTFGRLWCVEVNGEKGEMRIKPADGALHVNQACLEFSSCVQYPDKWRKIKTILFPERCYDDEDESLVVALPKGIKCKDGFRLFKLSGSFFIDVED